MAESKNYDSFEEYVDDQPEGCRSALHELRQIIRDTVPGTEELFNYSIPAFTLIPGGKRDQQVMIAGYKKHVGFYPHPTTMEYFDSRLGAYKRGKGSVQLPLGEPLPRQLIVDMLKYRVRLLTPDSGGS